MQIHLDYVAHLALLQGFPVDGAEEGVRLDGAASAGAMPQAFLGVLLQQRPHQRLDLLGQVACAPPPAQQGQG